jgi:hypothetical protein
MNKRTITFLSLLLTLCFAYAARAQSGGGFTIEQSVLGPGGGQNTAGGSFSVDGTIGQSILGESTAGAFKEIGGFWFAAYSPTAATVPVSGKVVTAEGTPIAGATVTMTDGSGTSQMALTNGFGMFRFDEVAAGQTYVFSVSAKQRFFGQPSQVRLISDETDDIIFVADN